MRLQLSKVAVSKSLTRAVPRTGLFSACKIWERRYIKLDRVYEGGDVSEVRAEVIRVIYTDHLM